MHWAKEHAAVLALAVTLGAAAVGATITAHANRADAVLASATSLMNSGKCSTVAGCRRLALELNGG